MQYRVYRSLDRSAAFFGIRGRYQGLALYALVADLVVSYLTGQWTNGLIGVLLFVALGAGIYLGILYVQGIYSDRTLFRLLASSRLKGYIKVAPMRLSALLDQKEKESL